MRRLAIVSAAFAAAVFAANYLLPPVWLLPLAAVFAAIGASLLLLRRRWLKGFILAFFGIACGLLCFFAHAQFTTVPAQRLSGQTVEAEATVLSYPTVYEEYCRVEVRLKAEGAPPLRSILYDRTGALEQARPGQRGSGQFRLRAADQRYGKSYDRYHARDVFLIANTREGVQLSSDSEASPAYYALRLNHALTERIDSLFPGDTAAFFKALMLGDKTDFYQDDGLYLAMSRAGFMHMVAVSGMHVAFLVTLLQLLMGVTPRSSRLCLVLVWAFVLLTGASPSAVRAAFMQSTLLMAPILGRENDPPTSLLFSLALILFVHPYAAADLGLQLSFASMAGLMLFSSNIRDYLSDRLPKRNGLPGKIINYLTGTCAGSISVLVFTVPLMANSFGCVSLLSPLANILALWTVPICFGGAYLACGISMILPRLAEIAAWLVSWLARYLFQVAKLVSSLDFSTVYLDNRVAVYWLILTYLLFALMLLTKASTRFKLLLSGGLSITCLCLVLLSARLSYQALPGYMTVLDIGQGQCLTAFAGQQTVMVDCGNIYSLDNAGDLAGAYLKSRGRKQVDVLMLTHLHSDHANGVVRLMEYLPVKTILMPLDPKDDDHILPRILEAADRHGTQIIYIGEDQEREVGGLTLRLFAPGESGDANERCLTALLSIGEYDMLVTGDMDRAAERELIARHEIRDVELLIVGHHGSRYASSGDLLGSIGADTAVISVGYNTYGHPTNETLERLEAYGYTIYRTDLHSTVEIRVG